MTIALISAERFELQGFAARLAAGTSLPGPLSWTRMGQWKGTQVICAANGPGFRLAGAAAAYLAAEFAPDQIWSIGIAGGLDHSLAHGDLCMGDVVDSTTGDLFPMTLAASSGRPAIRRGTIVSQDRVADKAAKVTLRSSGIAVEMEAAAVARVALSVGASFGCLKAISDTADEEFLLDLNAVRTADGRFSSLRIVRGALLRGAAGIMELARLFRASRGAVRSLEMRLPCLIQ
jgi:adenosylhomocysteine nucleosidase